MERSTKLFDITRGYRLGIFPAYQGRADPWQWRPCMPWPLPRPKRLRVARSSKRRRKKQWRKPTSGGFFSMASQAFLSEVLGEETEETEKNHDTSHPGTTKLAILRCIPDIFRQSLVRQKSSNLGEIFIPMTTKSSKYWDLYSISFLQKMSGIYQWSEAIFVASPTGNQKTKYLKIIAIYHGIYESLWIDILLCGMISDIDRHLWDCLWSSHVIP